MPISTHLSPGLSLEISSLVQRFSADPDSIGPFLDDLLERAASETDPVWILLLNRDAVRAQVATAVERQKAGITQPLLGIPFAVKDNIDVAGFPTTAGCPEFAYTPAKTATAVQRLIDAGAILIGKTNLDQFATGLVGTRSPYGACTNPFNPAYISGGSSSGSGAAVARGLVSFALGTDTAGSGRVPAAFMNIVGLKPTRGVVSTAGVFPACRSLDCVSVFALTCGDAAQVYQAMKAYDADEPFSRAEVQPLRRLDPLKFRFGVPATKYLEFFGDAGAAAKYHEAIAQLHALGGEEIEIDYAPFAAAARLLYEGPWVAERYAAVGAFIEKSPEAVLPVTRQIISRGKSFDAVSTFKAHYQLEALRAASAVQMKRVDLLLLPTTGTIYTHEQVAVDPIGLNTNLGYYTNFVNLLDLCGVAVPNGFQPDGLPVGVTLLGAAGSDVDLLEVGDRLHHATSSTLGATGHALPGPAARINCPAGWVKVAVVGAHLSGQPLNWQLTNPGGRLVRTVRTSGDYRLYALPGTTPPKPGLIRVPEGSGTPQEVEIWSLPPQAFGEFVAAIPGPLGIGTIRLEDGELVKCFVCEHLATIGARDISSFGGWRNYLASSR